MKIMPAYALLSSINGSGPRSPRQESVWEWLVRPFKEMLNPKKTERVSHVSPSKLSLDSHSSGCHLFLQTQTPTAFLLLDSQSCLWCWRMPAIAGNTLSGLPSKGLNI